MGLGAAEQFVASAGDGVYSAEEAVGLMDEGGVDAAAIHPPGWDPNSTELAFAAVRNYPGRFAIMGAVPLDGRICARASPTGGEQPGKLGLRYGFLTDPMRQWLHDGTIDWLWAAAEKAGVPVAALATDSLVELGRIAERHPGLRLTIDHLGGRGGTSVAERRRRDDPHAGTCSRSRNCPMWRSRRPACRIIRAKLIRFRRCIFTCGRSMTRSVRSACSGAPTFRRCRARGGSA